MKGQNLVLARHGFDLHDPRIADSIEQVRLGLEKARRKLVSIEGKFTQQYFGQISELIPEKLRPESRKKYKAYDGINNILNLAYEVLSWKVHRALVKASVSRKRKGKREYLNDGLTRSLMKQLDAFYVRIVEVPRIRIGNRQTFETLINEEALLLAKFLRGERKTWIPRIEGSRFQMALSKT